MKHIITYSDLFENKNNDTGYGDGLYNGNFIEISDSLAIWTMKYFNTESVGMLDAESISTELLNASKLIMNKYSDGYLYRGICLKKKPEGPIKTGPSNNSISWTFDKSTAEAFATFDNNMPASVVTKEDSNWIPVVMRTKFSDLKYAISIDVIMDNLTTRQVNLFKTTNKHFNYLSENEFVVLDEIIIPLYDISINYKPFGK